MDRKGLTKAIPSINLATLTLRDCTTKIIRRLLFLSVELKLNVSYISQECLPISSLCTVLMEKLQFPVPSLRGIILSGQPIHQRREAGYGMTKTEMAQFKPMNMKV